MHSYRRARNRKHAKETRRRKKDTIDAMQRELHELRLQKRFWEQQAAAGSVILGEGSNGGSHYHQHDNNDSNDSHGSASFTQLPEHVTENNAAARVLREESSSQSTSSSGAAGVHLPENTTSTSAARSQFKPGTTTATAAAASSSSKSADPMADYVPYAPFAAPAYVAVREQWCRTLLQLLSLRERCERDEAVWLSVVEPSITLRNPITPYRSHVLASKQEHECVSSGVAALIADAQGLVVALAAACGRALLRPAVAHRQVCTDRIRVDCVVVIVAVVARIFFDFHSSCFWFIFFPSRKAVSTSFIFLLALLIFFLFCRLSMGAQHHQGPLPLDTDLQGGFPPWAFSSAADLPPSTSSTDEAIPPLPPTNSSNTAHHRSSHAHLDDSPPVKVLVVTFLCQSRFLIFRRSPLGYL